MTLGKMRKKDVKSKQGILMQKERERERRKERKRERGESDNQ